MRSLSLFFRRSHQVAIATLVAVAAACSSSTGEVSGVPSTPGTETYASVLNVNIASMTKVNDNLYMKDSVVGTGAEAVAGKTISTTYVGYLSNGAKFDGGTISFQLGVSQVIAGWDQGIVGMKVGGTRKLVIGSTLGYGVEGRGIIPPNATMVFNITLNSVQ